MKIDVVLSDGLPDVTDRVRELAEAGVDGVATVEGPHDVFLPLALAARAAPVDLTSAVAIAFPRSPVHLAHAAWDLQALSEGRFRLGLGPQVRAHVERRYGAEFDRPVERMAEWVGALQAVFACWQTGEPLQFEGRFTRHTLMPPLLSPPPLEWGPPPVVLAAVGPRMVELATVAADGVVLHPFTSDRFFATSLDRVEAGLAAAERSTADFSVIAGAICGLGDTGVEGARAMVGFYGSTPAYRPVLEAEGAGDLQPELRRLTREGRWDELPDLVDDDLLVRVAAVGDATEVASTLRRRFDGRADRLALTFASAAPAGSIADLVDALR